MKLLAVLVALAVGCAGADPTAESDEDLSKSFTYSCRIAHHSVDALDVRVSKAKAKVLTVDQNEFSSDLAQGSAFTLDPSYTPHNSAFATRSKYAWDQSNTVLLMEQSLRTGGSVGYLTIEGGHVSRTRVDLVCRR